MSVQYENINPVSKRKKSYKIKTGVDAFSITIWFFAAVWCILFCGILLWAIIFSLDVNHHLILGGGELPEELHFENYVTAFYSLKAYIGGEFRYAMFFELLYNSVLYAVVTPFLALATAATTSYCVCKYSKKVKFVSVFFAFTIFCTYMPISGSVGATLKWQKAFGLYDTFWAHWIGSSGAFGSMFLLYYATYKGVDDAYIEAAEIDGASPWRIFSQIVFPMTSGTFWALYLKSFIEQWNNYSSPIMYLPSHPTISYAAWTIRNSSNIPIVLASLMIVITPITILFIVFRDTLLNANLSLSGLKG